MLPTLVPTLDTVGYRWDLQGYIFLFPFPLVLGVGLDTQRAVLELDSSAASSMMMIY